MLQRQQKKEVLDTMAEHEVDGDTVSVYYNDRLLFSRVALSSQAL